jgi:hypothetical protein
MRIQFAVCLASPYARIWAALRALLATLGLLSATLGYSWAALGRSAALGLLLACSWELLGHFWAALR